MPIDFSPDRWQQVKETYRHWWAGELKRPIIPVTLTGRDPGRPQPKAPILSQSTCADLTIPAEALIDRLDWELSQQVYLGDAFPTVNMHCFGPGVAAAFMGARLDNSTGRVWFHPANEDTPIQDIHFTYDPENIWLRRIKEICAEGMKRWQGQVLMTMTDLGGNLDLLSTFRPSEKLLLDLIDTPEQIERLTWEAHELWHRYFSEIHSALQPLNPGYSSWCEIYSDTPYYILQCDFSYMISPDMFSEFVQPELAASAKKLSRCFYHLDGKGQLPHLDHLLSIDEILGIQWIPGDGQPGCEMWPDLYRKIFAAGKKTQLGGSLNSDAGAPEWGTSGHNLLRFVEKFGLGGGIHMRPWIPPQDRTANAENEKKILHQLAQFRMP